MKLYGCFNIILCVYIVRRSGIKKFTEFHFIFLYIQFKTNYGSHETNVILTIKPPDS